jgi:hypothetical protein
MERLLEKSLDEQFAMENERKAAENKLNRRLIWVMLPLGTAIAIAAYYLDISTRIAIPVLLELQGQVENPGTRADYNVFRLNLGAFAALVPPAVVSGFVASWFAVWAGTYYRRKFIASMYFLIAVAYSLVFTALLGVLIPVNLLVLKIIGISITDAQIPHSDEVATFGNLPGMFPLSYLLTGMERGIWAGATMIILALIAIRIGGGVGSIAKAKRTSLVSSILAVFVVVLLRFGPLGTYQFLFDRFVQPPSTSILKFSPAIEAIP